ARGPKPDPNSFGPSLAEPSLPPGTAFPDQVLPYAKHCWGGHSCRRSFKVCLNEVRRMALTPRFWALWATVLLLPLALFAVLYWAPSTDTLYVKPAFHFWVVSGTTLAAAVAYGVVIGLTRSLRETRLIFLGLAFMCIAGVFSVHGLL